MADDRFREEIRALIAAGKKIEAIKRLREQTGLGLSEAKAAVEALAAGNLELPSGTKPSKSKKSGKKAANEVLELVRAGRKIEAIKLYREQTGLGLAEAKMAVEALAGAGAQRAHPPSPSADRSVAVAPPPSGLTFATTGEPAPGDGRRSLEPSPAPLAFVMPSAKTTAAYAPPARKRFSESETSKPADSSALGWIVFAIAGLSVSGGALAFWLLGR